MDARTVVSSAKIASLVSFVVGRSAVLLKKQQCFRNIMIEDYYPENTKLKILWSQCLFNSLQGSTNNAI